MSDLRPCLQCRRHVRIDEHACPFCAALLAPSAPPTLPVGRLTRAAVFAGAVLATACGGSQTKPDTVETPLAAAPDAGAAEAAAPPDAAVALEPPDAATPKRVYPDHPIPKPYGAPPARARLV